MNVEEHKLKVCREIVDGYMTLRSAHYNNQISSIRKVTKEWIVFGSHEKQSFRERVKEVMGICLQHSNAKKQIREKHRREGHLFNTFSLWNRFVHISEPIHSRILHFLLSNDDLHGQGNLFQLELLKMLKVECPETGQWDSTAEQDRVDVRLVRQEPHSVVIIENKSNWACDQPNQLYRYWYSNIHHCPEDCLPDYYKDNNRFKIVYLVPKEIKQLSEQSMEKPSREWFPTLSDEEYNSLPEKLPITPVIWSFDTQINQWLQVCEELLDAKNTPMRNIIKQYREYCKEL